MCRWTKYGEKHPPLAKPLVDNAELRLACQLSEPKELVACYLKARTLSNDIEEPSKTSYLAIDTEIYHLARDIEFFQCNEFFCKVSVIFLHVQ